MKRDIKKATPVRKTKYHATPTELAGIDRGLKTANEGRVVSVEQLETIIAKHRPAKPPSASS